MALVWSGEDRSWDTGCWGEDPGWPRAGGGVEVALASSGVSLPPGGMSSVMQGEVTILPPTPTPELGTLDLSYFLGFRAGGT